MTSFWNLFLMAPIFSCWILAEDDKFSTLDELLNILQERGYQAHFDYGYTDVKHLRYHFTESDTPIVALINDEYNNKGNFNHFVLVTGVTEDGKVIIEDPYRNSEKGNLFGGIKAEGNSIIVSEELWTKATFRDTDKFVSGQVIIIDNSPEVQVTVGANN